MRFAEIKDVLTLAGAICEEVAIPEGVAFVVAGHALTSGKFGPALYAARRRCEISSAEMLAAYQCVKRLVHPTVHA